MKNKKYYLIGALILFIGIIGYHFIAASQAEKQIDEAIQEQTEQPGTISIKYSEINIAPFSADITIRDLAIIMGNHIERTPKLKLDLGYIDFLNIYFGGAEYGLDHLDFAILTAINPSYTNRIGRQEIKSDTLQITLRGNALDGLISAVNGTPFNHNQSIEIQSLNTTFSLPETLLSTVKVQQLNYSGTITKTKTNFWKEGTHEFRMDSLTWTPPKSFQNKYSFFIKGFGYPTDKIPFQFAELYTHSPDTTKHITIQSSLKSELALLSASGSIELSTPLASSRFHQTDISLSDFSEKLNNVLGNIERLLDTSLSKQDSTITFQLTGSVSDPMISRAQR